MMYYHPKSVKKVVTHFFKNVTYHVFPLSPSILNTKNNVYLIDFYEHILIIEKTVAWKSPFFTIYPWPTHSIQ